MPRIDFLTGVHTRTKRNYLERVADHNKAECAKVAKQYGRDYWDGDRRYGYGGFKYDGRWRSVAEAIARHYGLKKGDRVLDIGCGKAFLLHEFTQVVPGIVVQGIDISAYAIENAKEEVRPHLKLGNATALPFEDRSFDLTYSLNTFHNLRNFELRKALQEIERVGKSHKYITVESWRTEEERVNMLYWQLTCASFYTPEEWEWFFRESGYTGDFGFIFFE